MIGMRGLATIAWSRIPDAFSSVIRVGTRTPMATSGQCRNYSAARRLGYYHEREKYYLVDRCTPPPSRAVDLSSAKAEAISHAEMLHPRSTILTHEMDGAW